MITDTLAHAAFYRPLLPQLGLCFDYLAGLSGEIPTGRVDLDGDRVFALFQRYLTTGPETRRFESHDRHVDLHYLVDGFETMYAAPTPLLRATEPTNQEKDYTLYADQAEAHGLRLRPGQFALFYPQDGHKTGCVSERAMPVTKVVIKIRLTP